VVSESQHRTKIKNSSDEESAGFHMHTKTPRKPGRFYRKRKALRDFRFDL
jgi:hypothetical protein